LTLEDKKRQYARSQRGQLIPRGTKGGKGVGRRMSSSTSSPQAKGLQHSHWEPMGSNNYWRKRHEAGKQNRPGECRNTLVYHVKKKASEGGRGGAQAYPKKEEVYQIPPTTSTDRGGRGQWGEEKEDPRPRKSIQTKQRVLRKKLWESQENPYSNHLFEGGLK